MASDLAERVFWALCRWDDATTAEVATTMNRNNPSQQRGVWVQLEKLVKAGRATKNGLKYKAIR